MNFFGKLYSKSAKSSWRTEGLDWAHIYTQGAEWLDRPFLEEKVCLAIFQLSRGKALSLDHFTMALYQEYCDVIKEDLMKVFQESCSNGKINQSTRFFFFFKKT